MIRFATVLQHAAASLALASACCLAQLSPAAPPSMPAGGDVSTGAQAAGNISSDTLTQKVFELYTTPSLAGSDLKPYDPIPGQIDDHGTYTHEITRLSWRPADFVDLYVIKPAGVKKPPVVLYLYSYPSENDRFLDPAFCEFLTSKGFAAVGFVSALTGNRYQGRPMREWFVSELPEALASSAHDVQMVLNYLSKRDDLDMDRVGMFGDGSGATIAILAASVDPRIKVLDLLNPWGDWPDWMAQSTRIPEKERPNFVQAEFLKKVAPLDPVKWLPELKTPRVRITDVKTVTITPVAAKQKIEAAAPKQAEIVSYDDAQQMLAAISGGRGFDWLKNQVASLGPLRSEQKAQTEEPRPLKNLPQ
jgi:hypothetical protein